MPELIDFTMIDRPKRQIAMRGGLRWLDHECRDRHLAVPRRTLVVEPVDPLVALCAGAVTGAGSTTSAWEGRWSIRTSSHERMSHARVARDALRVVRGDRPVIASLLPISHLAYAEDIFTNGIASPYTGERTPA